MSEVLEGIRVLDFGRYIAGPYCATLLGDMGAEVIRIEKIDGSEDRFLSPVTDNGDGALFMQVGRNKLSMTLNPMKPEGREIVKKLVATADVVVANLPPDTLRAMGLDYDSLVASRADIILTMISAFGRGGPYANRVGFDGLGQAMSGCMYLTGGTGQPVRAWAPFIDFGTASLAAFGTMAALYQRIRAGKGQIVEGSLFDTGLTMMNGTLIEQQVIERNRVASLKSRPDRSARGHFSHQGRLGARAIHRRAAVQALCRSDGGETLARRSAVQGRYFPGRPWRDYQRASRALVRGENQ